MGIDAFNGENKNRGNKNKVSIVREDLTNQLVNAF